MFTYYKEELNSQELSKTVVGDFNSFEKKIQALQSKWAKEKLDSDELRLISSVIVRPTNLVNYAVIADNLDFFEKKYSSVYETDTELRKALKVACLCGSEKIGDFLLNKLKPNYAADKDYNFVLGYVCASDNEQWVKKIAKNMKQAGAELPKNIYGYASYDLIDELEEIFKVDKPKFILNLKPSLDFSVKEPIDEKACALQIPNSRIITVSPKKN